MCTLHTQHYLLNQLNQSYQSQRRKQGSQISLFLTKIYDIFENNLIFPFPKYICITGQLFMELFTFFFNKTHCGAQFYFCIWFCKRGLQLRANSFFFFIFHKFNTNNYNVIFNSKTYLVKILPIICNTLQFIWNY